VPHASVFSQNEVQRRTDYYYGALRRVLSVLEALLLCPPRMEYTLTQPGQGGPSAWLKRRLNGGPALDPTDLRNVCSFESGYFLGVAVTSRWSTACGWRAVTWGASRGERVKQQ